MPLGFGQAMHLLLALSVFANLYGERLKINSIKLYQFSQTFLFRFSDTVVSSDRHDFILFHQADSAAFSSCPSIRHLKLCITSGKTSNAGFIDKLHLLQQCPGWFNKCEFISMTWPHLILSSIDTEYCLCQGCDCRIRRRQYVERLTKYICKLLCFWIKWFWNMDLLGNCNRRDPVLYKIRCQRNLVSSWDSLYMLSELTEFEILWSREFRELPDQF